MNLSNEEIEAWIREYEVEERPYRAALLRLYQHILDRNRMTIIDIKFVNGPGAGKKLGTVKTADDRIFGFFPDKVAPKPGKAEVTIESREYNGTTYHSITSYKPVAAADTPAGQAAGGGAGAPWWLTFVSNVVAHAIEAKLILGPGDVANWAVAAKDIAVDLAAPKKATPHPDDDDIPF